MPPGDASGYDQSTYGDSIAEVYDRWPDVPADTDDTVAFLAERAGGGPVLELGVGTGRVALPLAARGLEVHGIDASAAMVAKLRAKPGGEGVQVHLGDFADVAVDGRFALVFVVFNTFFALLSQEDQVRCLAGVAGRLRPGGRFVLEAFVPDVARFDRGQRVDAVAVGDAEIRLNASSHDPLHQRVRSQHVLIDAAGGVRLYPVQIRYAWPSELDLMARLAGLELVERHGGWLAEPFTAASARHVSVWARPGG
jgi:SAM-dependent methyltransferase